MKVKIGPYINCFGPYQIADLLQKVGVSEDRCYEIGEKLSNVKWLDATCKWIYEKRKRKIKVHIDYHDVWSMDHTLALVVLPMLKLLKEKQHGSPVVENEDLPEHLRHNNLTSNESMQFDMFACEETDKLIWATHETRWNWILDEMIWAFEQKVEDDWQDKFWLVKPELDLPSEDGSLRWKQEGVCDWEGMQKHQDRMTNGFRLFGKYYEGLWD